MGARLQYFKVRLVVLVALSKRVFASSEREQTFRERIALSPGGNVFREEWPDHGLIETLPQLGRFLRQQVASDEHASAAKHVRKNPSLDTSAERFE